MRVFTFLAVFGVACAVLPSAAQSQPVSRSGTPQGSTLAIFTSEGQDPFALVVRGDRMIRSIARSETLFYRSLEVASNGFDLYGASWDELYRINPTNGARTLLGKVRAEHTFRGWFSQPTTYANVAIPGPATVDWVLRATVEAPWVGTGGFLHVIDERGTETNDASVVKLYEVQIPIGDTDTLRYVVKWFWDFPEFPLVHISIYWHFTGGFPYVYSQGMFGADSDAIDVGAEDATLPLAGISLTPEGRLIGLSEGDWDVHGGPGLYELFIETNGVRATHLSQPDVPLTAIEFLDDGTLIGAGETLYEVDPTTGTCEEIGTTGLDVIADMDQAPDGVLYGVTLPLEGNSQRVELLPGASPGSPIPLYPLGRHWGLAVRQRNQAPEPAPPLANPITTRSHR